MWRDSYKLQVSWKSPLILNCFLESDKDLSKLWQEPNGVCYKLRNFNHQSLNDLNVEVKFDLDNNLNFDEDLDGSLLTDLQ